MLRIVAGLALAAGVLMVYSDPLAGMVRQWNGSPMYSYAFTVPIISCYMLWSRRAEFAARQPCPARRAGAGVILAALVLLVIGQAAAIQIVQQISFLVTIVGLVMLLLGFRYLRIAAPALAYLLFMIPFWDVFTERLHEPFQNASATLGTALLQSVGIAAYREGTFIALANVTLEVARACSGVNYLVAVLALALPLSVMRLRTWRRRIALAVGALIVSALANGLRVALIGALAHLDIGSPLHGPFHVLHGLFVAGIGYVVLFVGLHLLENNESRSLTRTAAPAPVSVGYPAWPVREGAAVAVVLWVLALSGTSPTVVPVALAMPLDNLPTQLGAWSHDSIGHDRLEPESPWNDADHQLVRRYYTARGRAATVQIWYFEAQTQAREIVNFRTADLHREAVAHPIVLADGSSFTANLVRSPASKTSQPEVRLFWYVLDGLPSANQYEVKFRSIWTVLRSGHSNGAAVMLRTPADSDGGDDLAALTDLAARVHAALSPHFHLEARTATTAYAAPVSR